VWVKAYYSERPERVGGSVNQVAFEDSLMVGVSGSLAPWYRFSYYDSNTWHPA
jgi:hypothetical protein